MDEQRERKSTPRWRSEEALKRVQSGQRGLRSSEEAVESTNRGRVHTQAPVARSLTRCTTTRWRSGENGVALHLLAASSDVEVQDDRDMT